MKSETQDNAADGPNCQRRLVRRLPIDYEKIVEESGLTKGRICKTHFGWGVQNTHGIPGPDLALIDPPPMEEGEDEITIDDHFWYFWSNDKVTCEGTSPEQRKE